MLIHRAISVHNQLVQATSSHLRLRVYRALTRNLRPGCLSILAAALILTTCTSGRCLPDNDSQSLPLFCMAEALMALILAWMKGIALIRVEYTDSANQEHFQG
jgi:hypothetical protein